MKNKYIEPRCEIYTVIEKYGLMDLVLSKHDEETIIQGGKEQNEFVEEEVAPTAPDLWGDDED